MIHFETNLLVTLRAFCVMTLIIFLEPCLCLSQPFLNVFGKLVSAHWTRDSDIWAMLKGLFIDTIILYNSFALMFDPELKALDVEEVFTFLFALKGGSLDSNLNQEINTF